MPKLVLICGAAGSGKSTVSSKISTILGYPLLSSDEIGQTLEEELLMNQTLSSKLNKDEQDSVIWSMAYCSLFYYSKKFLDNNISIIIDTNMSSPMSWQRLEKSFKDIPNLNLSQFLLKCDWDIALDRITKRNSHGINNLKTENGLKLAKKKHAYINSLQKADVHSMNAHLSVDELSDLIIKKIVSTD